MDKKIKYLCEDFNELKFKYIKNMKMRLTDENEFEFYITLDKLFEKVREYITHKR